MSVKSERQMLNTTSAKKFLLSIDTRSLDRRIITNALSPQPFGGSQPLGGLFAPRPPSTSKS